MLQVGLTLVRMATILKLDYARQGGSLQETFLQIQLLDNIIWKNKLS